MSKETDKKTSDELSILKQRARLMGIEFSNNIGVDTLREKIRAKQEDRKQEEEEASKQVEDKSEPVKVKKRSLREKLMADATKLVRLRIANLDPKKKDLPGEVITVANQYIGTIRKFVPYGEATDEGYHVPYVIYNFLKNRKFLSIRVHRRDGREYVETRWVPEYALEVLPPLTKEELDKLAKTQAARGG